MTSGQSDSRPIYVVEAACGSYYCNGHHIVGVYSDRERAAKAAESVGELLYPEWVEVLAGRSAGYSAGRVVELPLDQPPEVYKDTYGGCH